MASSTSFNTIIHPKLSGARVFPLADGTKKPLGDWNTPYEGQQNYAVHAGDSGLLIIDIDNHGMVDGEATYREMLGELPRTFTVMTPHGKHLYFKDTEFGRHIGLWKGVDVLGGAGYAVGPGSVVDGCEYTANDEPIAELPQAIRDALRAKLSRKAHAPQPGWANDRQLTFKPRTLEECAEEVASADSGVRNKTLNDVAYYAFKRFEPDEVWAAMASAASAAGLSDGEAQATINSACIAAMAELEKTKPEMVKDPGLFQFLTGAELDDTPFTYTINGLLPAKCNVLFAAYRKAGKTSTMLNMARALTTREDFFGEFATERVDGKVVYVNFELDQQMFRKYMEDNKLDLDNQRLVILNLRGKVGHFKILDETFRQVFAEQLRQQKCEVLIIDPLSAVLSRNGLDSDNNDAARMVLELFTEIQVLAGVEHVVIVDHTGHEAKGRVRGASGKEDWADVLWVQEKNNGDLTRKFKAEGRGVEERSLIIQRLEDGTIGTRLPEDVDGGDWARIKGEIARNPGIIASELAKKVNMPWTTLSRRLEKHASEVEKRSLPGKAVALYVLSTG